MAFEMNSKTLIPSKNRHTEIHKSLSKESMSLASLLPS